MGLKRDDLGRRFMLDVTVDGAVFVRERGGGPCPHGGLVFFSVDTRDEATALVVRHCRRANDGSGVYRLNSFGGTLNAIGEVADLFRSEYENARGLSASG